MRDTGYYEGDDETAIQGYAEDEKTACVDSHGRIYVTEMLRGYIQRRYGLGSGFDLVFHNYVSEEVIPRKLEERLSAEDGETHIVYAGTITSKTDGHHYDLRDIFREMAKNQLHIQGYLQGDGEKSASHPHLRGEGGRWIPSAWGGEPFHPLSRASGSEGATTGVASI
jgi:hypothetical protein